MGKLITVEDLVAKVPGTTKGYWAQLRFNGTGPKYFKPSPRVVVYDEEIVDTWILNSARTQTNQVA